MQPPGSAYRPDFDLLLVPLVLVTLFLASACAPGAATTLSGMGCADPSCNEVVPETRKVIGCIGTACDEPPPPSAAKKPATPEASNRAPQAAAEAETGPPAPPAAEADAEEPADWKIKVYYESPERQ